LKIKQKEQLLFGGYGMSTTQPLVTLEAACTVAAGVLAHARHNDLPPMTVAVLDAAGQLMAFVCEDGSILLPTRPGAPANRFRTPDHH
jgi:uncharacterized protein GlcG (DUF336 family)